MGLKKDLVIAKIRAAQQSDPDIVLSQKQLDIFETQSEYETRAILNFLTNSELKFTIEELKASVEIEELTTSDTLDANIKMTRTINQKIGQLSSIKSIVDIVVGWVRKIADPTIPVVEVKIGDISGISMLLGAYDGSVKQIETVAVNTIPPTEGEGEIEIPTIDLKKSGAQGGTLRAVGHAYVGIKDPVPNSDTQVPVEDNDFTSVVLLEDNIPKELTDGVQTGTEEYDVQIGDTIGS